VYTIFYSFNNTLKVYKALSTWFENHSWQPTWPLVQSNFVGRRVISLVNAWPPLQSNFVRRYVISLVNSTET